MINCIDKDNSFHDEEVRLLIWALEKTAYYLGRFGMHKMIIEKDDLLDEAQKLRWAINESRKDHVVKIVENDAESTGN
jgi:hypothetical protein